MKIILMYILNVSLIVFATIPQLSRLLFNNIYNSGNLWLCNPIWTFLCAWQFSLGNSFLYYLACHILVYIQILVYAFILTVISVKLDNKICCLIYILFVVSVIVVIPIKHNSVHPILRFLYWTTM